jgi:hypothetical protein
MSRLLAVVAGAIFRSSYLEAKRSLPLSAPDGIDSFHMSHIFFFNQHYFVFIFFDAGHSSASGFLLSFIF